MRDKLGIQLIFIHFSLTRFFSLFQLNSFGFVGATVVEWFVWFTFSVVFAIKLKCCGIRWLLVATKNKNSSPAHVQRYLAQNDNITVASYQYQ